MRGQLRLSAVLLAAFATVAIASPAFALHRKMELVDEHPSAAVANANPASALHRRVNLTLLAQFPNATGAINSDIAFWGKHAFVGNYDGIRIFDISGRIPVLIADFRCHGPQNDLSVYDRNGDGKADLLFASVDRTLKSAPGQPRVDAGCKDTEVVPVSEIQTAHDDPDGWEGIRVFELTFNRRGNQVAVEHIASVYQDCGSHTHTMIPQPERGRLILLNSSYPLRPGPTCGQVRGPAAGRDPLHGVIQVVAVPLANPAAAAEIAELPINYPGDPDNRFVPAEHGLVAPGLEPAMRACHDIAVFVPLGLVGAACAEQAQMWVMDAATGLPNTATPLWVYDEVVDENGATGDPRDPHVAVDFWHSATFTWDGKIVNFIDESFGSGCPTVTEINGVPSDTGRMFFLDTASGRKLSHFQIPRPETQDPVALYCSAHLGNVVPSPDRYLLVNAWYTGGVDLIDFTNPSRPREIAFWDAPGDNWSAYWYEFGRSGFVAGPMRIYATHGVEDPPNGRGFQAFAAKVESRRKRVDHLNPQTQEFMLRVRDDDRGRGRKDD
jgi:hypothetical protein